MYLLPEVDEKKPILIYGAGVIGSVYLKQLKEKRIEHFFKGFVETNPKSKKHLGYPLISLKELSALDKNKYQILIGSEAYQDEMLSSLISLGFNNKDIILPLEVDCTKSEQKILESLGDAKNVLIYPEIVKRDSYVKVLKLIERWISFGHESIRYHLLLKLDDPILGIERDSLNPQVVIDNLLETRSSNEDVYQKLNDFDAVICFDPNAYKSVDILCKEECHFFKVMEYEKLQMDSVSISAIPYMDIKGFNAFSNHLKRSKVYLEYGSGASTLYAAINKVDNIISIDTSSEWIRKLNEEIKNSNLNENINANLIYSDIGSVGEWGYPLDESRVVDFHKFSTMPWKLMHQLEITPDLILIDGRFRVACFLYSLVCAEPGTIILFDDYFGRDYYHVVENFTKPRNVYGRMAEFIVEDNYDLKLLTSIFAKYSIIAE